MSARRLATVVLGFLALAWSSSLAARGQDAPSPRPPVDPPAIHWATQLGRRVEAVEQAAPVVDRVVLVPDAATYLDELRHWSPNGRWPVLIEDDVLTPMFVRRFAPASVVRRPSVAAGETALPEDAPSRQRAMEAVVVHAWGGDPAGESPREIFDRAGYRPPGVVISSAHDPAWTAAAALAAGRGQPLVWLDDSLGTPNAILDPRRAAALRQRVEALVGSTGYAYARLGDEIETITICRSMAGAMTLDLPPGANVGAGASSATDPRAMTDVLGRDATYARFAFTGWIFGDEVRCAYVAMCSLFAPQARALLVNTYPSGGATTAYDVGSAAEVLRRCGFEPRAIFAAEATLSGWRRLVSRPLEGDVIYMNSKGNVDFFDLSDGRARSTDVPLLDGPAMVQFIHSWSLRLPSDAGTIGPRWLNHGAYAYVGSIHEPLLGAFVPPSVVTQRVAALTPFLVAARRWPDDGPFGRPWKVNTFGDPLRLGSGPQRPRPPRVPPPPVERGEDLAAALPDLMRRCEVDRTGTTFARALRSLVLVGRDDVAIGLWAAARQRGLGAAAARPALGPLFRAGRVADFQEAWDALRARDPVATDMLWLLLLPRLGPGTDEATLLRLESAIRPDLGHVDVELLAPHLERRFGTGHLRMVIERVRGQTTNPRVQRALSKQLGRD
jgi:hypothetical protein